MRGTRDVDLTTLAQKATRHPGRRMNPLVDSALDGSDPFEGTKYRSISILGKGGMGAAHFVEHRLLGTYFVCKVLRGRFRNNAAIADRMRVEAQSLARLVHPNIVKVFDFDFTQDGRPFIVMERLQGHTLGQELRSRGELPARDAIEIARQLLSALAAAHALGIVHRDVKLENLFLHQPATGKAVLKVLDFGVAKILEGISNDAPEPPQVPTRAGVIVGTPRFLSPEAALGKTVDQRADVYSASIVLYMLLCGRGPWDDAISHASVFSAQANKAPMPPSHYAKQAILPDLESIILTGMSREPEERFQTAKAFEAALITVEARLKEPPQLRETVVSSREIDGPLQAAPPAANSTLRISDDFETRTGIPAPLPQASVVPISLSRKIITFAVSAAVSGSATWWFLTAVVR